MSKTFKKISTGVLTVGILLLLIRSFSPSVLDEVTFSKRVTDRNGKLLRLSLSADEKYRLPAQLKSVSPRFIEALLLLEDKTFYSHPGVQPLAIIRGVRAKFFGGTRVGGSTLTMQLARVRYGLKTRTVLGKLQQIAYAVWIESSHSKKEILEAYLGLAPFGANIEGIEAASEIYFGKRARDLTLSESLLLAVIPQNPNDRSLAIDTVNGFSSGALKARERLFAKWGDSHPQDREKLSDLKLPILSQKIRDLPFHAPHFVEQALRGTDRSEIQTTLDLKIQKRVETKLSAYVDTKKAIGVQNASALLVDYVSGDVVALVGSKDFFDPKISGQVNGMLAKRSPGSALKPFVYALALDQGLIHPKTLLKDTPKSFGLFDPENFDQKFVGPILATEALTQSRNVPAVMLSQGLKEPTLFQWLTNQGVRFPRSEKFYGLGLTLGGGEVSGWDLGNLYATLANQGRPVKLHILKQESAKKPNPHVLSPEASWLTLQMLSQNQRPDRPFGEDWLLRKTPVAWKTGTSFGFRDAWTAGVVGPYVLVVWLGNFDNGSNPAFIGRDLAAPLFLQIAEMVRDSSFSNPLWANSNGLNVKKVEICSLSGHLPGEACPHRMLVNFIPGKSPITVCDVHRHILVDRKTGKRACEGSVNTKIAAYEFWPSDFLNLFSQAGIERKPPPAFAENCTGNTREGAAPQIISPRESVTYLQSLNAGVGQNQIPLKAVVDGSVRKLFWFANQRYLGASKPFETLSFTASVGNYEFNVVDDQGRTATRSVSIRASQ